MRFRGFFHLVGYDGNHKALSQETLLVMIFPDFLFFLDDGDGKGFHPFPLWRYFFFVPNCIALPFLTAWEWEKKRCRLG